MTSSAARGPDRWIVQNDRAVYLTASGDGVELEEVYDDRTPLALRVPAARALHALINAQEADRG